MKTKTTPAPRIVSPAEWLAARLELLRAEKELTKQREALAARRRALPWQRLPKPYVFESVDGPVTLNDLLGERSQLIVYHFMFGPGWGEGCKSCSFVSDHFDGMLPHLRARDVSFAVVSRAPLSELLPFKQRMGWQFNWVSSHSNDFNYDFHVSFTPEEIAAGRIRYNFTDLPSFPFEEAPGFSVFVRNAAGELFHTYSTYSRGFEHLMNTYNILDLVPNGRDEEGLEYPMEWVRYHDRYEVPAVTA
ncbi:MAG: DUF899 domain-containing protein [Opitutae bacterium]|nr:DUF899 domain-containing protein [Opitutae bacterium]